jgi:CRISPR-associated protein Cmr6
MAKEAKMIPISPDVRQLVGDWAEHVENRSLLHEKFALPKVWDVEGGGKLDNAGRWSVLRIVTRGIELLNKDAGNSRNQAQRVADQNPDKAKKLFRDATVAAKMAAVAKPDAKLPAAANANAIRFLADLGRSFSGRVVTFEATLGARLLVNLAGGVVENAGIALDRCFGLPFIPGSAVKGIARAQALWEIREAQDADGRRLLRLAILLFGFGANDIKAKGDFAWAGGAAAAKVIADEIGGKDFKGCASFLPGYPTTPPTLVVDMVNPHYPHYYGGRKSRAEDNENPIPNYFPAVEAGTSFGFAVVLNRAPAVAGITASNLLDQAKLWLERAVTRKGAGAKTAAGYGWFELGRKAIPTSQNAPTGGATTQAPAPVEPATPTDACIAKWRGKLTTTGNFIAALPELAALANDADLKRVFDSVIPESERRRTRKNNGYWQSFTSGKHGEAGKKILARLGLKLT